MSLVVFFRPSQTELYIAINDLKGNRDSVTIESIRICSTSSVGTDIEKAYNLFSKYINENNYTVYASLFRPSLDVVPTYWNENRPSNIFINDIYYSIFALLHKMHNLKPTYILSAYSYCLIGADLNRYFNNKLLETLKHKPDTFHNICYDKSKAYKFSKYIPKETYNYIKNNSTTFPWFDFYLKNKIENLGYYNKTYYKILISTLVWAESKIIYDSYIKNNQGKTDFGFSSKVLYYHAQLLIQSLFSKDHKTEDDEVLIADLQELLLTRLNFAKNRNKLTPELIEWHKQYMPNYQIYLPKISKMSNDLTLL